MGRHKFDSTRRFPSSRVRSQRAAPSPPAEPLVDGGGILDVVKNITKRTGRKAANKLAEKAGRKIGKEIASSMGQKWTKGPSEAPERSVRKKDESAGERIREILEANSITRMGHPSGPRDVDRRWAEASERSVQVKPAQWSGRAPGKSLNQAHDSDGQRRRAATQKVNETISKLLADDD